MNQKNRGWAVAFAGLGVNSCLGALYTWTIFAALLRSEFGWSATQTQIPYMTACFFFAFLMAPWGMLQDKLGPRPVLTASAILAGIGFFMSGWFLTVWGLTLFFGVVFGTAIGMGYSTATPAAVKWFGPRQRGVISGIVVGGFGLAAFFSAPLARTLLDKYDISRTFNILGLLFFTLIILLSRIIDNPPAGYGQDDEIVSDLPAQKDVIWSDMIRTPQFYCLWVMLFLGMFAGLMIIGQLTSIGQEQALMAPRTAVLLVSVYALFNFIGRIGCGFISDRFDRKTTLALIYLIQVVCYLAFPRFTTSLWLFAGTAVVAFAFGGILSIFPVLTCEYFGEKNLGLNYGIVYTAWGVGGLLGPLVGGLVRDLTGTYTISYYVSAALSCLGFLLARLLAGSFLTVRNARLELIPAALKSERGSIRQASDE